jgi:hypothetical protein
MKKYLATCLIGLLLLLCKAGFTETASLSHKPPNYIYKKKNLKTNRSAGSERFSLKYKNRR